MKKILFVISIVLFAQFAMAGNIKRLFQDVKLPTQKVLEHETVTTPIVATTNYIKTTYAGPTDGSALVLSSFTHQPDVPRNITITPTGTTTDVESCVITVAGTNVFGQAITENLTFAADASTVQTGSKAFKTVTSVSWPASCESGGFAATWVIGVGSKLGLSRCMDNAGGGAWSIFDGAFESTRGTWTADATHVELNTLTPNGTMNAAKNVEAVFFQNFQCLP